MKTRIILAAVAAPLLFGGMQTSALASTCVAGADGAVSCDVLDDSTTANAIATTSVGNLSIVNHAWASYYSTFVSALAGSDDGVHTERYGWNAALTIQNLPSNVSDFAGTMAYGIDFEIETIGGSITSATGSTYYASANITYSQDGGPVNDSPYEFLSTDAVPLNVPPVAVPGPEAGDGLGALAMGGIGAIAYRRKRKVA